MGVLDQVSISDQREAERRRAELAHHGDRAKVPVLSAAHKRHRRARPGRLPNRQLHQY